MGTERVPKKPKVDTKGLANEWDNHPAVREYLRDPELLVLFPENTRVNVRTASFPYVNAILEAILLRSATLAGHPQPAVVPLRKQLELVYKKVGRTTVDEAVIIADSWYIRKFLGLVKLKTRKLLPSTAPCL